MQGSWILLPGCPLSAVTLQRQILGKAEKIWKMQKKIVEEFERQYGKKARGLKPSQMLNLGKEVQ